MKINNTVFSSTSYCRHIQEFKWSHHSLTGVFIQSNHTSPFLCLSLLMLSNDHNYLSDCTKKMFNSLDSQRFWQDLTQVIFKLILMIDGWGISCETALRWMSLDLTDDKSTLVQAMARSQQATNHYLNQCWPWSMWYIASVGHNELTAGVMSHLHKPTYLQIS